MPVRSALPRVHTQIAVRAELLAELDEAHAVTVLRAPAGYGKTSLLAYWAQRRTDQGERLAWLTVPQRLCAPQTIALALFRALSRAGVVGLEPTASTDVVLAALQQAEYPVVLVVDAAERLRDADRESGLQATLAELVRGTSQLRLMMATRSNRGIRSTMRPDVDVLEIGAEQLTLTPEQTAQTLRNFGVSLPDEQIAGLHAQFGGWPTAVYRLGAALQRAGGHRDVSAVSSQVQSSLRTTVLRHFDADTLARFAMPSAVLGGFTREELASSLAGTMRTAQVEACIEQFATSGLLIADGDIDDPATAFRWPAVAGRVLYREARRTDPQRVRRMHAALAHRDRESGSALSALSHAVEAQDWAQVVDIIDARGVDLLLYHLPSLRVLMQTLPPQVTDAPRMAPFSKLFRPVATDTDEANDAIAQHSLAHVPDRTLRSAAKAPQLPQLVDRALYVGAAMRQLDLLGESIAHYERLSRFVDYAQEERFDEIAGRVAGVETQTGIAFVMAGQLERGLTYLERGYRAAPMAQHRFYARDASAKLALTHALRGDVVAAERWLAISDAEPRIEFSYEQDIERHRSVARLLVAVERLDEQSAEHLRVEMGEIPHSDAFWMIAYYAQAQYALLWGARSEAARLLDLARARFAKRGGHAFASLLFAISKVDLFTATDAAARAHALLPQLPDDHAEALVRQARFALYAGQQQRAHLLARAAIAAATATPRTDIEALLIDTSARHRLGDERAAAHALREAARHSRSSGAIRGFLTTSRRDLGDVAATVPEALAILAEVEALHPADLFADAAVVIELTEREREILLRLGSGASLPEIARQLSVSVNTVKTQTRHLYRKLDANDRQTAILRAQAEGLL